MLQIAYLLCLFYFIHYPLFMKSKHMVCIHIGYYLYDSCLYFLIGIYAYVVIDIIYLFINVIQLGDYCILYNFII